MRATIAARAREVIDRQVGQLVRLVDDLLDVSRITANKIQLRRESLDLARVVATAVESIAALAAAAGITRWTCSCPPRRCGSTVTERGSCRSL